MSREYDPTWGVPSPAPMETRQDSALTDSYTDLRVQTALAEAIGETGDAQALGAVEIAAGTWGRSLAAALVTPSRAASVLTPEVLEMVGRQLVRFGNMAFEIQVHRGSLRLLPMSHFDVYGGPDPDSWRYYATFSGPQKTEYRTLPAERVLHFRHGALAATPWRGRSPLAASPSTSALAARLEAHLASQAKSPAGTLLAVPEVTDELQRDVSALDGGTILAPAVEDSWAAGGQGQINGYNPVEIGMRPSEVLPGLRSAAGMTVLAACGVPIELVNLADGTGNREAMRRFATMTLAPVARSLGTEAALKLDLPGGVAFSFEELRAADVASRARAFADLVTAGKDMDEAAAISGVLSAAQQ